MATDTGAGFLVTFSQAVFISHLCKCPGGFTHQSKLWVAVVVLKTEIIDEIKATNESQWRLKGVFDMTRMTVFIKYKVVHSTGKSTKL